MSDRQSFFHLSCGLFGVLLAGCPFEFSNLPSRPHGSVGAEVFRVVCMNLAAQSFPNDLTGASFSARCDGTSDSDSDDLAPDGENEERAYARYRALVSRRTALVEALDVTFDEEAYRPDELRDFLGNMVPLYDPPEQLPELTRAVAGLLAQLILPENTDANAALGALERISAREGYRPARYDLALTRALLTYPKLDEVVRSSLASVAPDGPARGPYEELLRAGALDLASADGTPPDPNHPGSLDVTMDLLLAQGDVFKGQGAPLLMTLRDSRGVAQPTTNAGAFAAPFQDQDGDGRADIDAQGRFVLAADEVATPYATFEQGSSSSSARDPSGRALDANGQPLYTAIDLDRTLLAGLVREAAPLLRKDGSEHAPLSDFVYGMNELLGDYGPRTHDLGTTQFAFEGPDTDRGPLFDFVHAIASVLPFERTDAFLDVFQTLVRDHERELTGLIEAILYIKERSDAYPDAVFEKPHDFWDGMIEWALKVTERPELLEGMLRALGEEGTAQAGPLIGNFMRFRDRVNYPLGSQEEMEALGVDPKMVLGNLRGDCEGASCGAACDLTNPCPAGLGCVVSAAETASGVCGSVAEAVAAHRLNVNFPCPNPPVEFLGAEDPAEGCVPHAHYPAPHHRGIRGCPAEKPQEGESCAEAGGVGLCSWDQGSCSCDCAGGLCRHGAQPTWHCTNTPTPGYEEWVDRSKPDVRKGDDGRSNQSLFQRTVALIHDLHVPAKWCNKDGAKLNIYEPAGSNTTSPLNVVMGVMFGDDLGPYEECGLLNERSIVEFFARTILGTAVLELQNPDLQQTMTEQLPNFGITQDQLMERQTHIRGLSVAPPKPEGIARMVFSPSVPYQEDLLELTPSRDGNLIVDLHRDTITAWELNDPISGASYYTALAPFLAAMDPTQGKGQSHLDLYGDIISLAHRHWSSRKTDTTTRTCEEGSSPLNCEEDANLFSYQSNLVSYEELVAEALVDAQLMSRLRDLSRALSAIQRPDGKDGISVLTNTIFDLVVPSRSCLNLDCKASPLRYRDGRASTTTNTGHPVEAVSPLYLLLDSLNAIDARLETSSQEKRLPAWRRARSRLVDVFFDVERDGPEAWRFKSPRGRAILDESLGFLRRRLAQYRQEEAACDAANPAYGTCHQVHDWAFGLAPRLARSLGQPVSAAALRLMDRLRDVDSDPAGKVFDLVAHLTGERANDETFAQILLGVTDLLQALKDTENLGPLMVFGSRALSPNANAVTRGAARDLEIQNGTVEKAITLVRSLQGIAPEEGDRKSTIASLLARLASPHRADGATPLDVIVDAVVGVNRAAPSAQGGGPLSSEDLRALLHETEAFMSSERHGLERLYDIVQSRELP